MNASRTIAVCIATLHRREALARALRSVALQRFDDGTRVVAIVVNNDPSDPGPEAVAASIRAESGLAIEVLAEPIRGIAPARNRALARARDIAPLIAFLDDDEEAPARWLASLLRTKEAHRADVVTGTVLSRFEHDAPDWAPALFARPERATGSPRPWAFTGNVLFDAALLDRLDRWFDPRFMQGEDRHFFARLAARGARIAWCADDAPTELVPASRTNAAWLARRMRAIGRSVTPIELDTPRAAFARPRNLAKGCAWIAIGGVQLLAGLLAGAAWRVRGRSRIAYGVGLVEGAFAGAPAGTASGAAG